MSTTSPRLLRIAGLPAVLIIAIAVWEIIATRSAGDGVPDDAAWNQAAADVRAAAKPGDLIVFAPEWIDPVGRMHVGDLIPLDMAGRMDAARYGTIWELSIRGAHSPETSGLSPTSTKSFAGVTVRRFERAPVTVLTDFVAAVPTARTDGHRQLGPTVELAEVGFSPRRCVQIVPLENQSVRITFPAAMLGKELVGYVGLADVFTRRDVRDPGRLEVIIGGKSVARADFGVDDGWVRFATPTTPGAADVTFLATAVGLHAHDRRICFAAEARQ